MNYQELKQLIKHHNHLYYDLSNPEISDQDYDKLYDKLEEFEKKQGWADHDSPTVKVGGSAGKIKHKYPLYSLKKVYNADEVNPEFTVETRKVDGSNLTLTYKSSLIRALTRGNGEEGEDVLFLARHISNIPSTINTQITEYLVVTGECVTDNKVENFRNYVSGALGLLDEEEFKTRNIKFIAHDWLGVPLNYTARMKILENMGFNTVLQHDFCDKYPQDGKVFRLDSYEESQRMGYTSKYPKFAVALKQRELLTAVSILQEVIWVVGRTGTVNPVGIISPVNIDGATINRVTLHNLKYILDNNLGLGDTIKIERAGGIIPKFVEVVKHAPTNNKITKEHAETYIGTITKLVGPKLYCAENGMINLEKNLENFVKNIGIKGLGPASIKKLNLIHPSDLYKDQPWDAIGANGEKIKDEIDKSKYKPYHIVLGSLGIPGVGLSTAKKLVQYLPTFEKFRDIEYINIPGIGPKTIEKILAWLDINEDWVFELPLNLSHDTTKIIEEVNVNGKKVCITGKLDITREDLTSILESKGYVVKTSVTKDLDYLICDGPSNSSKYLKATQLGIIIINYWEKKKEIINGIL